MNDEYKNLIELGKFYIISQKFEEALKVLKKAQRIKKNEPNLYYNLGIAYEALNENDKAINAFRSTLELAPDFKSAQEHLEQLIEK
jgi:Flp pilus assembly protein TadD